MKLRLLLFHLGIALLPVTYSAAAPASPVGHWEGGIQIPGTALEIRLDFNSPAEGSWSGDIDIPVQGLRGFHLDQIAVKDTAISFVMSGIPGDPHFAGQLSADGKTIHGDFSQNGQTFPFQVERKARPDDGATPAKGIPGQGLVGYWQGSLYPTPFLNLRLALEIESADAHQFKGTLRSLDQGNVPIPFTTITEEAGAVHLELASIHASFDGKMSADGSEVEGHWKQGRGELPLTLKRLAKTANLRRPQEPVKPYPYDEEEVTVTNSAAGITLAGTLTKPRTPGPHPAAILITGSGQQDRDEALMGHRPFLVLADHLTRKGFAVLRCDDRGMRGSKGDFSKATEPDFVQDTLAMVDYLRSRKDIDPKRIGLIGHSEGGVIAPRAAVEAPDKIAYIVMMAGIGVPMEDILVRQAQDIRTLMGGTADNAWANTALQKEMFHLIRTEKDPKTLKQKLCDAFNQKVKHLYTEKERKLLLTDQMLEQQINLALTPWFRDIIDFDPRPTLARVKCPVLAIDGEKDSQVAAKENLPAIRAAIMSGGNSQVKTVELPGLNHLFQHCKTGAPQEYSQIEETFAPEALTTISDWLQALK